MTPTLPTVGASVGGARDEEISSWSVTACLDPTGGRLWIGPCHLRAQTPARAQTVANRSLAEELARLRQDRRPRWTISRWRWPARTADGSLTALAWLLVDDGPGRRPVAVVKIRLRPQAERREQARDGEELRP